MPLSSKERNKSTCRVVHVAARALGGRQHGPCASSPQTACGARLWRQDRTVFPQKAFVIVLLQTRAAVNTQGFHKHNPGWVTPAHNALHARGTSPQKFADVCRRIDRPRKVCWVTPASKDPLRRRNRPRKLLLAHTSNRERTASAAATVRFMRQPSFAGSHQQQQPSALCGSDTPGGHTPAATDPHMWRAHCAVMHVGCNQPVCTPLDCTAGSHQHQPLRFLRLGRTSTRAFAIQTAGSHQHQQQTSKSPDKPPAG